VREKDAAKAAPRLFDRLTAALFLIFFLYLFCSKSGARIISVYNLGRIIIIIPVCTSAAAIGLVPRAQVPTL